MITIEKQVILIRYCVRTFNVHCRGNARNCRCKSSLHFTGRLLQAKGKKDATREAKQLFQRALDIRTAKQGVYHVETKLIRRALMSLETVDVSAKFSGKGTVIEKELRALDGVTSRPLTKSSSRNLDFRQASGS